MSTSVTLTPQETWKTFLAMQRHGGGFCAALAYAWFKGDTANRARIERAFPHLLEDFGPGSYFYTNTEA